MNEKEKQRKATFEEMWEAGAVDDLKESAKQFFDEARTAKLPEPMIEAFVSVCATLSESDDWYTDNFAMKDIDLKPLQQQLKEHKHLPTGEAVETL